MKRRAFAALGLALAWPGVRAEVDPTTLVRAAGQGAAAPRGAASGARAARGGALPAVRLAVDWRVTPAAPGAGAGANRGAVVVGTAAPVPPGWQAVSSADAAAAAVQSVRVANGQEARLRLDRAVAAPDYEFIWTAQGQGVVGRERVTHAVQSLRATPRWPGGAAPVTLALEIQHARPAPGAGTPGAGGDGEDLALQTTVDLAFDEWLTVAELGARREALQVRVRRP